MEDEAIDKKREGGCSFSNSDFVKKEAYYRALACRTRLKILAALESRPMFGHELVRRLGIGQSTVSYHVGILRRAGLIKTNQQREGTLYSLPRA